MAKTTTNLSVVIVHLFSSYGLFCRIKSTLVLYYYFQNWTFSHRILGNSFSLNLNYLPHSLLDIQATVSDLLAVIAPHTSPLEFAIFSNFLQHSVLA